MGYDALYDALKESALRAPGDVFPVEPIPSGDKAPQPEKYGATPHLAGSSRDIIGTRPK